VQERVLASRRSPGSCSHRHRRRIRKLLALQRR
jgi:hypothetical protein